MPDDVSTVALSPFDRLRKEALAVAIEYRDYLTKAFPHEVEELRRSDPFDHAAVQIEASHLTSEIAFMVAWTLEGQAVDAGELAVVSRFVRHPGNEHRRLSLEDARLPPGLIPIMRRCMRLKQRIIRLDGQMASAARSGHGD